MVEVLLEAESEDEVASVAEVLEPAEGSVLLSVAAVLSAVSSVFPSVAAAAFTVTLRLSLSSLPSVS